jgi:AAA+ ATPase superfamily predicted ATPase
METFIDRKRELSLLEERYRSGKAEFVVIYGRRRVGKTALIEKFLEGKKGVRLLAREESKTLQLNRFSLALAEFFGDEFLKKAPFREWDGLLDYLAQKAEKERVVVAMDEFPNLLKEERGFPSILQDYWDRKLSKTRLFLILCGSSISMMETRVLGHRSPLYGRRTGQLLLRPFRFLDVFEYVGDLRRAVEIYSVLGGTPAYLLEADPRKDIFTNLEKILREDSFILRDVEFVLRQELTEPRYYFSILLSIARGNRRIGLISNDTGLGIGLVNKYLSVLADLQLARRVVPVTEGERSKKGLWFLSDNLFDFWFRFIYPHLDEIERGKPEGTLEEIESSFEEYTGRHFEEVCREILEEMNYQSLLPSRFSRIDPWWHGEREIDAVGIDFESGDALFAECKWRERVDAEKVLENLREKTKYVPRRKRGKEYFAIFAKSFGKKVEGALLFDLQKLEEICNKLAGH